MFQINYNNSFKESLHYKNFQFIVKKDEKSIRIDKFLINFIENITRNKIKNIIKEGNILVNNKIIKQNYKIKPLDIITVNIENSFNNLEIISENIPLDIIYEDNDLIVINKSAGMVVHPGHGNYNNTLLNALKYYFNTKNKKNFLNRMGLVHRIDKNTSGLLIIAKNNYSLYQLSKQFFNRSIQRHYIALVWGIPKISGTIRSNIGRNLYNRQLMEVFPENSYGKLAITHYKIIEKFNYVALIRCNLETGRTHQIRVHFKHIGYPLFNDDRYGGNKILKGKIFSKYKQFIKNCFSILEGQFLHAQSLGFIHPTSKNFMYFELPLPKEMSQVLNKWRNYLIYNQDKKI